MKDIHRRGTASWTLSSAPVITTITTTTTIIIIIIIFLLVMSDPALRASERNNKTKKCEKPPVCSNGTSRRRRTERFESLECKDESVSTWLVAPAAPCQQRTHSSRLYALSWRGWAKIKNPSTHQKGSLCPQKKALICKFHEFQWVFHRKNKYHVAARPDFFFSVANDQRVCCTLLHPI